MASVTADRPPVEGEPTGLKANAIGFVDALVIGLASTAPAYSLAAVMGTLAVARERARAEGVEAEVELVLERPAARSSARRRTACCISPTVPSSSSRRERSHAMTVERAARTGRPLRFGPAPRKEPDPV